MIKISFQIILYLSFIREDIMDDDCSTFKRTIFIRVATLTHKKIPFQNSGELFRNGI